MKEFEIGKNEEGRRLDKFVLRILSSAPAGFCYKMLRKKNITLNGKKCEGREILRSGDHVEFFLSDKTFEKFSKGSDEIKAFYASHKPLTDLPGNYTPEIIYEDENVLIVNKTGNMLTQKAKPSDVSLNEYCLSYLFDKGFIDDSSIKLFKPSVLNRLDRNTSGLVLFAKSYPAARILSAALKDRTMDKYYRCIVKGRIDSKEHVCGRLVKDRENSTVRIYPVDDPMGNGAGYIKTYYEPIVSRDDMTLLSVKLITGKSHQIRAHLSYLGHPILGDPKYGDAMLNKSLKSEFNVTSQLLHAYRIVFPVLKAPLDGLSGKDFTAKMPDEFMRVMGMDKAPCKEICYSAGT